MIPQTLEAFERLSTEQDKYLSDVNVNTEKWTKFRSDYLTLKQRLQTMPDVLSYDCMIPFGRLAFIPGKIIHTNELNVLLGENYFVQRSCKQAINIVDRRLINIEKQLEKYNAEYNLFKQQQEYTKDIINEKSNYIDIKEDLQMKEPTVEKSRRENLTDEQIRNERQLLQQRALELADSFKIDESKQINDTKNIPTITTKKKVQWKDNLEQKSPEETDDEEEEEEYQRHSIITIRHSNPQQDQDKQQDNSQNEIKQHSQLKFFHPGEIGRKEGVQKSILKADTENFVVGKDEINRNEASVANPSPSAITAFTGRMIERIPGIPDDTMQNIEPVKRTSKFKASRS
ncbi:unnamed protein product [Didymodactylos carnosus]|uniref:Uncharacterized protein n=1 Tax=Didymodactylos carnosus TaxID=1234261 RepID=A0A814FYQ7_9BILA|nr:unnamed protein product [Didymodactylos carnosus]CAF3761191.1 unnamed protein product [Didymodactylos carnosus]